MSRTTSETSRSGSSTSSLTKFSSEASSRARTRRRDACTCIGSVARAGGSRRAWPGGRTDAATALAGSVHSGLPCWAKEMRKQTGFKKKKKKDC